MSSETTHDAIFMADNLFWHFSLSLYNMPEVQDCCLQAQDTYGQNVNLVLFTCWLSTLNRQVTPQIFQDKTIQLWQTQVTHALRSLRKHLKIITLDAPLRQHQEHYRHTILNLEIETEHALQDYLFYHYKQLSQPTRSDKQDLVHIKALCQTNLGLFTDEQNNQVLPQSIISTLSQATCHIIQTLST